MPFILQPDSVEEQFNRCHLNIFFYVSSPEEKHTLYFISVLC